MSLMKDLIADIEAYESGQMDEEEQIGFFAHLFNVHMLERLQGHYGRTFADHVNNGDIEFILGKAVTTR